MADPQNPTNEEKAQIFNLTLLTWGKQVVRSVAEGAETDTVEGQIEAAGDTAVSDLT